MEWASNRVLLSSTENYILNGKDCETEHRPVVESPCCTAATNTTRTQLHLNKSKKPLPITDNPVPASQPPFWAPLSQGEVPWVWEPHKSTEAHAVRHRPLPPPLSQPCSGACQSGPEASHGPETPPRPDGGGREKGTEETETPGGDAETEKTVRKTDRGRSRGRETRKQPARNADETRGQPCLEDKTRKLAPP